MHFHFFLKHTLDYGMRETRAAPGIPQYSPVAWTKTIAINQKEGLKEKEISMWQLKNILQQKNSKTMLQDPVELNGILTKREKSEI